MRARCKRKEARVRGDADTGAELRLPPETPGAETHTPVFPKKGMVDKECSWAESSGRWKRLVSDVRFGLYITLLHVDCLWNLCLGLYNDWETTLIV